MKKVFTITVAVELFFSFATAIPTLADTTITMTGTVPQVCNIVAITPGNLSVNAAGDSMSTDNAGGIQGSVRVTCNKGTSLKLSTPIVTTPAGANAYKTTYGFKGGAGNALFVGATGDTIAPVVTNKTGATANVSSTITALNNEYITPGYYSVVIPVILTP
jgi:hypothetical protein